MCFGCCFARDSIFLVNSALCGRLQRNVCNFCALQNSLFRQKNARMFKLPANKHTVNMLNETLHVPSQCAFSNISFGIAFEKAVKGFAAAEKGTLFNAETKLLFPRVLPYPNPTLTLGCTFDYGISFERRLAWRTAASFAAGLLPLLHPQTLST